MDPENQPTNPPAGSPPTPPTPPPPAQAHPLDLPAAPTPPPPTSTEVDTIGTSLSSDAQQPLAPPADSSDGSDSAPTALKSIASGFAGVLGGIFSWVIFPIAVVLILHNFVFQAYHVLGTSMVNTLHDTDYLIISKVGYTQALIGRTLGKNDLYLPARGEIIVFHYPKDTTKIFIKRVVGEPGDHIVIKNGTVTIFNKEHPNGFDPDTKYEPAGTQTLIDTDETVAPGNLFVMGDNRTPGGSFDSREWGELPSSYIIGNAVLRLLPLDQVRIL